MDQQNNPDAGITNKTDETSQTTPPGTTPEQNFRPQNFQETSTPARFTNSPNFSSPYTPAYFYPPMPNQPTINQPLWGQNGPSGGMPTTGYYWPQWPQGPQLMPQSSPNSQSPIQAAQYENFETLPKSQKSGSMLKIITIVMIMACLLLGGTYWTYRYFMKLNHGGAETKVSTETQTSAKAEQKNETEPGDLTKGMIKKDPAKEEAIPEKSTKIAR